MTLAVEHDCNGPYGSGRWVFTRPETGEQKILTDKAAGLLALLLAEESLERGRLS